ncbi:hypothetical protein [Undibacterium sp. TS12]|uniref:hypothetical protein n=1 Tax=Undibacterium sp. TS12 TaxID=2908202 RepID=UPI001F4C533B|nr:hypothetical protein [Undibacterium sp. TS12]MCH8623103.1 hypothetical protein [Undibacterium sp. TS12]
MTIYWNKTSIPSLKGLSKQEQSALILPVFGTVWQRWQVWLPVLMQIVGMVSFMILMPQFQYRLPVIVVMAYVTVKLAFLPFNHFLALELEKKLLQSKA